MKNLALGLNYKKRSNSMIPRLILAVLIFFGLSSLFDSKVEDLRKGYHDIRLPDWIKAERYEIVFETNLETFQFNGTVSSTLNISKRSKFIVVHKKHMQVTFRSLTDSKGSMIAVKNIEQHDDKEYMVIYVQNKLSPGSYHLKLYYEAELATDLAGYYRSSYKKYGEEKFLATTQFEPTDCRKAFPVLDEPNQKAVFDISMIVDEKYKAMSNMPAKTITSVGPKKKYVFEPTVKMSPYLVAFIVSDFECISDNTSNGVVVSVCTVPGSTHLGEYALKTAIPVLEYYQTTYGIDFPLPKVDMVAIPDFSAGAMENWGLITYRDTALLYDPTVSTVSNKQRVATVVGHELAHQWFGNLVTIEWWSDLWLNEGFAAFMEYKSVDAAEPKWEMLDQFIPVSLVQALHADESLYTHAIQVDVNDPAEINELFDDISYGKGSSVIRMLEAYMDQKFGQGVFFQKLHNYLVAHAYGNTRTEDLWKALNTNGEDIGAFMSTWTNQPGFPFLTFSELNRKSVVVEQERFIFSHLVDLGSSKSNSNQVWSIPLTYSVYSNSSGTPQRLGQTVIQFDKLGKQQLEFEQEYPEDSILLANYLQTGVYRSLYNEKTYKYLTDWLMKDLEFLPAVERGGLISDVFSMTFSGHLKDPIIALELVKILTQDTNYLVWQTALKDLNSLKSIFALFPTYGPLVKFQTHLLEKMIGSIGWSETCDNCNKHSRALLRSVVLSEAVRSNHPETVSTALQYFKMIKQGKKDQIPVGSDLMGAILDAGVIYGDSEDYDFVMELFKKSTFAPDQQLYLHALASASTPYLQTRTLEFAMSKYVRDQDRIGLIQQVVALNPLGHVSAWIHVMDNWDAICNRFEGKGFSKFTRMLEEIVASFTKPYLIRDAERLFVDRMDPDFYIPVGGEVAVKKGLETAKQFLAWRSLYGAKVTYWLGENGYH